MIVNSGRCIPKNHVYSLALPGDATGETNCHTYCRYWLVGRLSGAAVFLSETISDLVMYIFIFVCLLNTDTTSCVSVRHANDICLCDPMDIYI